MDKPVSPFVYTQLLLCIPIFLILRWGTPFAEHWNQFRWEVGFALAAWILCVVSAIAFVLLFRFRSKVFDYARNRDAETKLPSRFTEATNVVAAVGVVLVGLGLTFVPAGPEPAPKGAEKGQGYVLWIPPGTTEDPNDPESKRRERLTPEEFKRAAPELHELVELPPEKKRWKFSLQAAFFGFCFGIAAAMFACNMVNEAESLLDPKEEE